MHKSSAYGDEFGKRLRARSAVFFRSLRNTNIAVTEVRSDNPGTAHQHRRFAKMTLWSRFNLSIIWFKNGLRTSERLCDLAESRASPDQSRFTRVFTRLLVSAPGVWRRNLD